MTIKEGGVRHCRGEWRKRVLDGRRAVDGVRVVWREEGGYVWRKEGVESKVNGKRVA